MLKRRAKQDTRDVLYGTGLIQEFISVLTNASIVNSMKREAARNEDLALRNIVAVGASNSIYTTPHDIPIAEQASITKASVDAHIQKAQSLQAEAHHHNELQKRTQLLHDQFRGKKVVVRVLDRQLKPVDTFWRESKTGRLFVNQRSPKKLTGVVENIDLINNLILLKPTMLARAVNRTVQYHRVYIVNPDNMQPIVELYFS